MESKEDQIIFTKPSRSKFKTYSHLLQQKQIPSEYELVTSKMLYYVEKGGFEVITPISDWYAQYQKKSLFHPTILEEFVDPQRTTYSTYVQNQKNKEIVLDATIKHMDEIEQDLQLSQKWLTALSQFLAPLRYPWHGLQMIASYLGSMAPVSKIVIVFAFQAMDEMRRIQRVAYRMRQLQYIDPTFGIHSKDEWQHSPLWQPLRKSIERLLVTYDWEEGFIALNLCFKPILDYLLLIQFSNIAKKHGDSFLEMMFHSFWEDACWHQTWTKHLVGLALKTAPENKLIVQRWLTQWTKELIPAVIALKPIFFDDFEIVYKNVALSYRQLLDDLDLSIEVQW